MKQINEQELKQLCEQVAQQAPYIKQNHAAAYSDKSAVWSTLYTLLHRALFDDNGFVPHGDQTTPAQIENLYIDAIKRLLDKTDIPHATCLSMLQNFSRQAGLE